MNSIERLTSWEDLTTLEHTQVLLQYLQILQDGRTKPDTSIKGGYIRESVYNIPEIEKVKEKLNYILSIYTKPDTLEFDNRIKYKHKK